MLKKLFQSFRPPVPGPHHRRTTPEVINKSQHSLQRHQFSRHAVNIVERLQSAGYQAYLVGGCVRDLMLGITPKDFDVATSATPEQVRAEFRNARIIGRRFKLVHVHFGREIIEVATFRAPHSEDDQATATVRRTIPVAASCVTTFTAPWKKTRNVATSPSMPCTTIRSASAFSITPMVYTMYATACCG